MEKFPTSKDYKYWIIGMAILVLYFSTKNLAANDKVVEFAGFAGTIASILLAIIAIIYSYQQTNQSSKNYTDTQVLLNSISERVNGIGELKVEIANSNMGITDIKKTLTNRLHQDVKYINSNKDSVEKLIDSKIVDRKGYQDFQILLIPKEYDFNNPKKIDANIEYLPYVNHYRKVTNSKDAIAFNVDASADYFGFSFNLTIGDVNMNPNILKAIMESYESEYFKVFTVARLIYST